MGINIHNYEQYFLDHLEGNLSQEMERELSDFLSAHPELKPLLDEIDIASIAPDEMVIYHPKEKLKKDILHTSNIHEANAEEWMIASIEGLLDSTQEKELADFIKMNPVFQKELEAFRKTRLRKDESIIFPNKDMLFKKAPVLTFNRVLWASASIAAMLLLFFGIQYFITPGEDIITSNPVQIATNPVKPEIPAGQEPSIPVVKNISKSYSVPETEKPVRRTALNETLTERLDPYRMEYAYAANPIPAEQNQVAQVKMKKSKKIAAQPVTDDKPLIVKVADNLFARAERNVKENIPLEVMGKQKFSFWRVLNSGIKGYNTVTDRNIELYVRRDADGKVSSYTLVENDRLITTRDMNRN